MTEKEIAACRKKIAKATEAWKEGDPPVNEIISMSGFLGKAKGSKQISYERGLWKEGMMMAKSEKEEDKLRLQGKQVPDPSFYVDRVLGKCRDFLEEKNALAELIESRGHILLLGVKCHPEMAGCGVEYIFGYSKRYFRKHNNCKVKDLEKNVRDSLSPDVITSPRMWKFERRTWLYQQMYLDIHDANTDIDYNVSYEFLEKSMKDKKATHRNIFGD